MTEAAAPAEEKKGLTPEEVQAELNSRVEEFNKELLPLLGKYDLGLGAVAFVTPKGTIGAKPIMFDARETPEQKQEREAKEAKEKGGEVSEA